jgi:hypothetical protein
MVKALFDETSVSVSFIWLYYWEHMSRAMTKPTSCVCDQLFAISFFSICNRGC